MCLDFITPTISLVLTKTVPVSAGVKHFISFFISENVSVKRLIMTGCVEHMELSE